MKKLLPILLLFLLPFAAFAVSPLQIGIDGDDLQLVARETPVLGLRLNLPTSYNDDFAGLDLGIVSSGDKIGGLSLNALSFANERDGVALALFDFSWNLDGIQVAFLGVSDNVRGLQLGAVNFATEAVRGVQIGLLNRANPLRGVQLGLLNLDPTSSFPWLPLLRIAF